jgi:hypothetical protein
MLPVAPWLTGPQLLLFIHLLFNFCDKQHCLVSLSLPVPKPEEPQQKVKSQLYCRVGAPFVLWPEVFSACMC